MILRTKGIYFAVDHQAGGSVHVTRYSENDSAHLNTQKRRFVLLIHLSLLLLLLGFGLTDAKAQTGSASAQHDESRREAPVDTTLLVWAGEKAHIAPDFLAVIDFPRIWKGAANRAADGPWCGWQ